MLCSNKNVKKKERKKERKKDRQTDRQTPVIFKVSGKYREVKKQAFDFHNGTLTKIQDHLQKNVDSSQKPNCRNGTLGYQLI